MKLKKLVKKGGIADIVTLMIIVGLVIALIIAVVIPMINDSTKRQEANEANMGMIDDYISGVMEGEGIGGGEE